MAVVDSTTLPTVPTESKLQDQLELREEEYVDQHSANFIFDQEEVEPELHARTWIALAAMNLLVFTQVLALQGPPAVVRGHQSPSCSISRCTASSPRSLLRS